jgi:regulatory subunit for Cdc7p protein kinase
MAAVSISPLPHTLSTMSSRRVPLSSNPNAANSPYRALQGGASKQKRSYATIQREDAYGQPPPAKKQMLDAHQVLRTPPRQQSTQSSNEGRVFTRKSNASQQSSFERKLVAVRDKPAQQVVTKADKTSEENLDTIRQWQKHYRKIFPTFVFYFESISEDVRLKYTKQVIALGAVSSLVSIFSHDYSIANNLCSGKKNSFPMPLLML